MKRVNPQKNFLTIVEKNFPQIGSIKCLEDFPLGAQFCLLVKKNL
jgi:hypothetical protein